MLDSTRDFHVRVWLESVPVDEPEVVEASSSLSRWALIEGLVGMTAGRISPLVGLLSLSLEVSQEMSLPLLLLRLLLSSG